MEEGTSREITMSENSALWIILECQIRADSQEEHRNKFESVHYSESRGLRNTEGRKKFSHFNERKQISIF